jgi:hypothetical protein
VILETVREVTVEVMDMITQVLHLIAQITVTHVTAILIPVTHHTAARIATALARVASVILLETLAMTRHSGRTRTRTST